MTSTRHEDNGTKGRFLLYVDDKAAGEMTYSRAGDHRIIIDHTEVDPAFSGQGLGKKLVQSAVDYARAESIRILPLCPFAKRTFEADPSIRDVLDQQV